MKKNAYSALILITAFLFIAFTASAQKLPNVQQVNLRAPADIKTDGKATEWNNQFQAYNKGTNVYYTIANDDKNLYLTVQASDPGIITKVMFGGVNFIINTSGKKSLNNAVNITYPAFEKGRQNAMYVSFGDAKAATDSFAMINNSRLATKSKYIRVIGIKGLDTLTSIYNRDGIKAVSLFDNKMVYTYELAVALSLLDFDAAKPEKFTYNIALPGLPSAKDEFKKFGGTILSSEFIPSGPVSNSNNPHGYLMDVQTDFWGEYILAK